MALPARGAGRAPRGASPNLESFKSSCQKRTAIRARRSIEAGLGCPRMIRNTSSSWGSVARSFHWILGATILAMLVDESCPAAAGPLFPPLHSCRYRLPPAHADGRPPGLARPQSEAGVTIRYAAVVADRGAG